MINQEKGPSRETTYARIVRLTPEGNWTDAAAKLLTDSSEIEEYIKEEIAVTLRPGPRGKMALQHTPDSLVASIKRVIDGPNVKTDELKAIWRKALRKAIEESDYFR